MKKTLLALLVVLALAVPVKATEDVIIRLTPTQNAIIIRENSQDRVIVMPPQEEAPIPQAAPPKAVAVNTESVLYSSGPYFLLQGGVYGPANGSGDIYSEYDANPGAAVALAIGYRFNPMWSIQTDIGWQMTDGLAGFNYNAMPVTAAIRLGLPAGRIEPYILAGGGAWFTKVTPNEGSESVDSVAAGGYFGLGALMHFSNKMAAGVEARYQMLDLSNAPNDGMLLFATVGYEY